MAGLPDIPGPKLHPFDTGGDPLDLEFIEHLGKGLVSYVWKVRINGNEYALKIFTYYRVSEDVEGVELNTDEVGKVEHYLQPFQCECRAFGRLKEFGMERLGVGCYGYITLNDEHMAFLRQQYDFKFWDYDPEYDEHEPVHAIVKDLVYMGHDLEEKEYVALHVGPKTVPKMKKDLKTMHRLGIRIRDINFSNYIHGKFLDLSHAWTAPHPLLRKEKESKKMTPYAIEDARAMDEFIDEWNTHNPDKHIWDRLLPNRSYTKRLRLRKTRKEHWDVLPENFTYESAAKMFKVNPLRSSRRASPPVEESRTPSTENEHDASNRGESTKNSREVSGR